MFVDFRNTFNTISITLSHNRCTAKVKNGERTLPVTLGSAQSQQFPPEQKQMENKT
jgi:hypothetical protein